MGDCYVRLVPVPRFLQRQNSVETLVSLSDETIIIKRIGMQKDYMCTSMPCQSSMDYENTKTTQHAQKHMAVVVKSLITGYQWKKMLYYTTLII